jgi:predicted SprT family Zn-dependent metalloprotease
MMGVSKVVETAKDGSALLKQKQVSDRIQAKSAEYFLLWGRPELAGSVIIQFSGRLRSSLGRTRVDVRRVRLNPLLASANEQLLNEVLCHELAHIAVYERFGTSVKPHGSEWASLVQRAGFEPRLRHSVTGEKPPTAAQRFEHLCPVCQTIRYAKRSMTRWRCGSCVDAGLEGKLLIRSIGKV